MNKLFQIFAIIVLGLCSINVYSNEKERYILQNLNQDFIHCYAYWKINKLGAQRAKDQRRAKLFSDTADRCGLVPVVFGPRR